MEQRVEKEKRETENVQKQIGVIHSELLSRAAVSDGERSDVRSVCSVMKERARE